MPIPHPKPALSLIHDLLRVLSMDTWWNFGHELKKNGSARQENTVACSSVHPFMSGKR